MTTTYEYAGNCVGANDVDALVECIDDAVEVEWSEFLDTVGMTSAEINKWFGYDEYLRIEDDWAVRVFRSTHKGRPCVYVNHSAIEYVWKMGGGRV